MLHFQFRNLIRSFRKSGWLIVAVLLILMAVNLCYPASMRVRGALGLQSYGYTDPAGEDHLWLFQNVRFSVTQNDGPLSLHFSGGHQGDNQDDFGASSRMRFLKGYLQYGRIGGQTMIRAGRFFLHRGVALGILDGIEASRYICCNLRLTAFAGTLGPLTRKFEFEDFEGSFSAGGEVLWTTEKIPYLNRSSFAVSYVQQKRQDLEIRNMVGLTTNHRIGNQWKWRNRIDFRLTGEMLSRIISRLRYNSEYWNGLVEAKIAYPDVAAYSWFNDFAQGRYQRFRIAIHRLKIADRFGIGVEGGMLMADGSSGVFGGPVVTSPWGQVGYRINSGDYSTSSSPWFNAKYQLMNGLDIYGFGSMTTYEWDAFDIESEDLMALNLGAKYSPAFYPALSVSGEFQIYRTPQLEQDRRAMGGIVWTFDSRRKQP